MEPIASHPSVTALWAEYVRFGRMPAATPLPPVWHFCDNETDANVCLALALSGRKRATTASLWFFEATGQRPPEVGDLEIVTAWNGAAGCIIRTTHVEVRTFAEIDATYAAIEGEGDGSLDHWRATHWAYYERELAGSARRPAPDMPLVCQQFEVVWRTDEEN